MKLQFAFGNPRKAKRKKKASKKKLSKVKAVKSKTRKKSRRIKRKKNPVYRAYKGKRLVGQGRYPGPKEIGLKRQEAARAERVYKSASSSSAEKAAARRTFAKIKGELKRAESGMSASLKDMETFAKDGAVVKTYADKEPAMAGKKGKGKKPKTKKKPTKKVTRKTTRKTKRKPVRKATKKVTKKTTRRTRRRRKMITHRHAKTMRHLPVGAVAKVASRKKKKAKSYKVKTTFRKGKRKVRVSGSLTPSKKGLFGKLRINPFGGKMKMDTKKLMGLEMTELGALAVGGALVPIVNSAIGKVPGADKVVGFINQYAGPQATGSIVPILVGVLANMGSDYLPREYQKYGKMAGEGLCAAGVIGLTMSLSQRYAVEGLMSGILYTPMSGINYTPMSGINYTPMGVVPQLAGRADFGSVDYGGGDGYTEARNRSSADFGRYAMDNDSDEEFSEDDIMSENLSGGLG